MCYSIYLSTDSDLDLSRHNTSLLRFERESIPDPITSMLAYKDKWYVASKSGCSCTFRHLSGMELGFGEPEEWYPEDDEEIAATLSFIKVVRHLLEQGHGVDCLDLWAGADGEAVFETTVNLASITDEQFRFFENHHFRFVKK